MKRRRSLIWLLLFPAFGLATFTPPASAQTTLAESDPLALIELERAWNRGFYERDVDLIDSILADEFVATYDDGSMGDKAMELALTAEFNQQVYSSNQDGFKVKVYGDTAVVWFTLHLSGLRDGERLDVDLRFTDVFVWRDGRWQCVSSQSTRINPR